MQNKLDLILGIEKDEDFVITSKDGNKILLIRPDVTSLLEGKIVDFMKKRGFIVSKDKEK